MGLCDEDIEIMTGNLYKKFEMITTSEIKKINFNIIV